MAAYSSLPIVLAGGGTGGHLYPGLALAEALKAVDSRVSIIFMGTSQGLEARLVPQAGYPLVELAAGRGSPISFRHPWNAARFGAALAQCARRFFNDPPAAVVSLGGYAAAAPGILARWRRIPLVLLEQNAIPGRVTRLLSRWAGEVHLQFDEARTYLSAPRERVFHTGTPVREKIAALYRYESGPKRHLLILGGSQGAERLNFLASACAPAWMEAGIPVAHITGERDYAKISSRYRSQYGNILKDRLWLAAYADDMAPLYGSARLALMRAGASTAAEAALAGLPAILVPFPKARDDHQAANAGILEAAGAAKVIPEEKLTEELLHRVVLTLWRDAGRLDAMSASARRLARPDAAQEIAERVLALARRRRP
ncbi:MAG: undecaprenyldiphospho-muramoylpentapeptide beta-N-acetylglucosaminyltransferase, partial [Planctomycetota bacterium]